MCTGSQRSQVTERQAVTAVWLKVYHQRGERYRCAREMDRACGLGEPVLGEPVLRLGSSTEYLWAVGMGEPAFPGKINFGAPQVERGK